MSRTAPVPDIKPAPGPELASPSAKPPPAAKQGGRGAAVVVTLIVLAILGLSVWYLSVPTSLLLRADEVIE